MNLSSFKESLSETSPPASLSLCLTAFWYDATGKWNAAHELIDDIEDKQAAWVHAYLHRKEGDRSNAKYWYTRAGRTMPELSLAAEWEQITIALL
ncbi:MAG: hypothetical protein NVSMB63_10280 [Sediminibacterium sp.]